MTEVERGNLKVKVDINNKDELGKLGTSFNSMITRLEKTGEELQKQHEQQIRQADKLAAIGELASGIAHEIKNPLAGIGSAIQVLAKELNLSGTYREVIDEIMVQLERLNKNTRTLLSFAKPGVLNFLVSDLNEIINKTVFFVRNKAEENNTRIILELEQNLSKILIDSEQIQQVFLNIILNAIQAMPDGGSLSIATRLSENTEKRTKMIAVSFTDTGIGIPKEHLRRIFNPFFTTKNRGTGLGLFISRTIVENHGGHIEVISETGKGTVFTVLLPIRKDI
jgi:signal transduction histidine kinase